jgi:hydroxymethylpyrimidine kinase/phosphomethylpyrimidine kinase
VACFIIGGGIKARILTIAGSDPSGGAGIQADLKVITILGGYGISVITALTAQNTLGVQGIFPVPESFVRKQFQSVLSDIGADAVKTGMLTQREIISQVVRAVKKLKTKKLVIDPVMVSGWGQRLLPGKAGKILKEELFPLAGLITPNLDEASEITGMVVQTLKDMKKAARAIKEKTQGQVLIKGGHLKGEPTDLFFDGVSFKKFTGRRIRDRNFHGTGCTFSAAITTFWGQGLPLVEAIGQAKDFVAAAIAGAQPIGHGRIPTEPYAWLQNKIKPTKGVSS